jgi:hypothetical protein
MSPQVPRVAPAPPLIIGDAAAVRACLDWLQDVDQSRRQLAGALDLILRSGRVGREARTILLVRLHQAAADHATALCRLEQRHEEVVAAAVWSYVGPVVGAAKDACIRIMGLAERRTVTPARLMPALDGLRVPRDELRGLWQLLNDALPAEAPARESPQADRAPEGGWSIPAGPAQWAKVFNCSQKSFVRMIEARAIQVKVLTSKLYQIAVGDLPAREQIKHLPPQK